jgi:hypothetical protein
MSKLSRPYNTIDDAALGGFKKIMKSYSDWDTYEYGFIVIGAPHQMLRQLGHEGFIDTEMQYYYTEPHTDRSRSSINHTVSPYAAVMRAFCHTHPSRSNFSSTDFENFKKLRELKAQHKLGYAVSYYLMDYGGQVRRSNSEETFYRGTTIEGLDKAQP